MQKLTLLLALFIITGCNNSNPTVAGKESSQSATVPEKEQQLIDLTHQFPDSVLLKENLIQYYRDNGNYGQALGTIDAAIQQDSIDAHLWDIKGTLHFENGDTLNAIKAYEAAVTIRPLPEYVMSLGSLYAQTRNPRALEVADGLLQATKAGAALQALFIKGLYYTYAGEKEKAIGFFNQCLSIDYNYLNAYREKAICLYDLKKYKEALDVLDRAITINASFDEGYYWMGRTYEQLQDKKNAATCYQNALIIDKDYIEAKDALVKLGVTPQ